MVDPISIIGYVVGVGGGILALFSRIPNKSITNYEKLPVPQEKYLVALADPSQVDPKTHLENLKSITK